MSCPVCFGGDDPVVRESLNAGIGVLLGVTSIVLGCFARFFVTLARRGREFAQSDANFDSIDPHEPQRLRDTETRIADA